MTRREFLAAANATALLVLLESCSLGPFGRAAASPLGALTGRPYEQAVKLLRDALQASPDDLADRAAAAVATRDPAGIVDFVRGSIAVVPPLAPGDDASTARRWGSRATLRSGLGTLRDRAELLAELLNQAGLKAHVEVAERPSSLNMEAVYRPRPLNFAPDPLRMNQARSALRQGGFAAPSAPKQFDPGPDPVAALLSALPATAQIASPRADLLPANVPVVVFEDAGKQRYALAIGDTGIVDGAPSHLTPRDADAFRNIAISVSAVANPTLGGTKPRGKLVDLVSASWPADEVVGRQVIVTFQPPQGAKAILDFGLGALPMRAAVLRVQGAPKLVEVGQMISAHGDVLGPAEATSTDGPYGALKILSGSDRSAALSRVKSVAVRANATAFPDVELEVALTDGGGAPVDGLDAAAFSIKEQGPAVDGFVLYSNTAVQPRPRVLVVYDAYVDFAPDLFSTATAKSAFESALAKTISDEAVRTPFDVQVVPLGAAPNPSSWAAPSEGALTAAFAAAFEAADDPWGTVGGPALDQNVSGIVMVSDFDSSDTKVASLATWKRRLIASRVPVFAIPTGRVESPTVDAIVGLSGGSRLNPPDLSPLPALLASALSGYANPGYRMRYRAKTGDPAQRTVAVAVGGTAGDATYAQPSDAVPAPAFAGLYVTITFGPLTATRRIAGVELSSGGEPLGALDDPAIVAETLAALNGVTTIAIEGGTPTTAAVFADVLDSFASMTPFEQLPAAATSDQFLAAARDGVVRTPLALPSLLRPVPVDPGSVLGFRVAILQQRALPSSVIEEHADLAVGLNEVIALPSDRHAAFKSAIKTSVVMSAAEAATYADSAYQRMSGKPLAAIQAGDYPAFSEWLKTVPVARQAAWSSMPHVYDNAHLVLPIAGAADALWVVDRYTGAAKAVLLDTTGGAIAVEGENGKCHISGEDGEALALAGMSLECAAAGEEWPIFCTSVNTMASGMCVIQLFEGKGDLGTPIGAIEPWLGLGEAGLGWLDAAIGMCLIAITLSSANCV